MSIFDDLHAIRTVQEQRLIEEKEANQHRKAMNDHLAAIDANLTTLAAVAKKLAGDDAVGIIAQPGSPTTHSP